MKTFKKILILLCIIIITLGMFLLGRNGLNYTDRYTQKFIIETAKEYSHYVGISTIIILLYFIIRYNKQGIVKVIVTTILGILGTIVLILATMAIIKMPINILFFPIMLLGFVASIIVISANFEENK